jgi:hypothetical protein
VTAITVNADDHPRWGSGPPRGRAILFKNLPIFAWMATAEQAVVQ